MPTNPQSDAERIEEKLDALRESTDDRLAGLAARYAGLKALQDEVKALVGGANRDLQEALQSEGLDSVRAGPILVTINTKRGIGLAEGGDEEEGLNNMQAAREWVQHYNPTQPSITQANLKKTWEEYLEAEGGDVPMPSFLRETEVDQLSLRRSSE
jgi:hypothetical protein